MPYICQFGEHSQNDAGSSGPITWIDIHTSDPESHDWLMNQSDIDQRVKTLLSEGVNVTRREKLNSGQFVALCGVKQRDRNEMDEVVSVCLLLEEKRVITAHAGPLPVTKELQRQIESGQGPRTPIEFFAQLAVRCAENLENAILDISAETDDVEDRVLAEGDDPPLGTLNTLRYRAFQVRRQLVPLRNLLSFIAADQSLQIDSDERHALSGASEEVIRYLEGLDDCRERAQLLHDQMEGQFAATMTRVSYNLTIVATVFLPLSFITGLLGMNVAGMPDKHNPAGFWIVCVSLVVIAVFSWLVLRWRKWV